MIPADVDPAGVEEILIAEAQNKIDSLSLDQQDHVYKALSAFQTIFQGYGRLEAELALVLMVYQVTGICIMEVQIGRIH